MSTTDSSSNPFESPREPNQKAEVTIPAPRRGRLAPPFGVRLIAAGFVLMAGIVRWFNVTGDQAIVNVLTFLMGLLACITLGIWFTFFSGYRRRVRWGMTLGTCGMLFLLVALYRVDRVSGELVPTFRPRWTKRADEALSPATPANSGLTADLATTTSDDFPQFLGPQRNGRVDHVTLDKNWSAHPPQLVWKQPIGAGWSAFSAVNGFTVTMEQRGPNELVTCYEVDSGKLVWSYSTASRHATIPGGIGPRSTPTIDRGFVYSLGATGELLCLEGGTGNLKWRTNLLERYHVPAGTDESGVAWGRSGSPLIVDDLVIVPAGGPVGGPYVSLAAFHRLTGELVWEAGDQQVSYSSPILASLAGVRQVVCVHEKVVSGHDPQTGKQLWSTEWLGNSTQEANVSQPVPIGGDHLLLSKAYGRGAKFVSLAATPDAEWSVTEVWSDRTLLKTKFTNLVLYQGHAYGLSDGTMECVEVATGKRSWKQGRFGQGQILGVGEVILVQAESGAVAMIAASPAGFDELGRFQAVGDQAWNNLCLYGKRLLVRNSEEAACYDLP